jgi:hypothetical protein
MDVARQRLKEVKNKSPENLKASFLHAILPGLP